MIKVGAFDAKTRLSALLDEVSRGQEVLITKRGKAVARLVPAGQVRASETVSAISELRLLRKEVTLNGLGWKDLRDEGR